MAALEGKPRTLSPLTSKQAGSSGKRRISCPAARPTRLPTPSPALATLAGRRQILIVNESTASGHDPATGQRLWSHPWPGDSNGNASVSQAVAVEPNRVLLTKGYGGGAELVELSASAGDELTVSTLWKSPRVLQTKFSNVVIKGEHAFAPSEGILECVELKSGRRRWKSGRYGHGQILGVGDLLLVVFEEGGCTWWNSMPKGSHTLVRSRP